MKYSHVKVDTVFRPGIATQNSGIIFRRIDFNKLPIEFTTDRIPAKYHDPFKGDNFITEYFILYNGSNQDLEFIVSEGKLNATEFAQHMQGGFKRVSLFFTHDCGTTKVPFKLKPGELAIVQNSFSNLACTYKTRGQLRLKTKSHGLVLSGLYERTIDENSFNMSIEYRESMRAYARRNPDIR